MWAPGLEGIIYLINVLKISRLCERTFVYCFGWAPLMLTDRLPLMSEVSKDLISFMFCIYLQRK
jgi:hypothetical protein